MGFLYLFFFFFVDLSIVRRTVKNSWSLTPPPRGKEHLETKGTKDKRTELRTASSDRASVFLKPLSHVMNAFAVLMLQPALPAEFQVKSLEPFRLCITIKNILFCFPPRILQYPFCRFHALLFFQMNLLKNVTQLRYASKDFPTYTASINVWRDHQN